MSNYKSANDILQERLGKKKDGGKRQTKQSAAKTSNSDKSEYKSANDILQERLKKKGIEQKTESNELRKPSRIITTNNTKTAWAKNYEDGMKSVGQDVGTTNKSSAGQMAVQRMKQAQQDKYIDAIRDKYDVVEGSKWIDSRIAPFVEERNEKQAGEKANQREQILYGAAGPRTNIAPLVETEAEKRMREIQREKDKATQQQRERAISFITQDTQTDNSQKPFYLKDVGSDEHNRSVSNAIVRMETGIDPNSLEGRLDATYKAYSDALVRRDFDAVETYEAELNSVMSEIEQRDSGISKLAQYHIMMPYAESDFASSGEVLAVINVLEQDRKRLVDGGPKYGAWSTANDDRNKNIAILQEKIDALTPILEKLQAAEQQALIDSGEYRYANTADIVFNSASRGWNQSKMGVEYNREMFGLNNDVDKYEELLASDRYKYIPKGKFQEAISGTAELLGQMGEGFFNWETQGLGAAGAGTAFVLGQLGPQAAIPEELLSMPGMYLKGIHAGMTKRAFEVESGLAYKEMLENGISEATARKLATGVGVINAGLEMLQLDEVGKAFKILQKNPATQEFAGAMYTRYLKDYGINLLTETGQEIAQEGVTTTGVQVGSKIDTGEWAYTAEEVVDRLVDTGVSSFMSFALLGGASATSGYVFNRSKDYLSNPQVKKAVDAVKSDPDKLATIIGEGKLFDDSTKAAQTAKKVEQDIADGKEVSDKDVAELIVENSREYVNENADFFVNNEDNLNALIEEGQDIGGKSSKIADDIAYKVSKGEEVTREDVQRLIEANERVDAAEQQKATEVVNRKKAGYGEHGMSLFNEENAKVRDPLAIISEMDTPYQAGLMNKKPNTMTFNTPLEKLAFNAGVKDYIAQRKVDKKHKAIVYTEEASTFNWENAPADITQEEKNLAEYIVKSMGVAGDFSSAEQAYNAFYDPDTGKTTFDAGFGISPELTKKLGNLDYLKKVEKLAKERGQSFTFYLAHEIATHRAMDLAPKEMRAFINAMYEYKQSGSDTNLAREVQDIYRTQGRSLDTYTAMEEVVADVILDLYGGDANKFADAIYRIGNSPNEYAKKGMQTYFKWLGDFIEKLKAWVQKLTGRENATLKANVEQSISEIENLRNMFEKAIETSMKTVAKARAKGKAVSVAPQTTTESNIKESIKGTLNAAGLDAVKDENGRVIVSIGGKQVKSVTAEHIRDNSAMGGLIKQGFYNGFITEQEAETQYEMFADIVNMIINTEDPELVWAWTGSSLFSAVKSNADGQYGTTIDFTTICRKTQDMITAMSKSMMKLKRGLTKAEITELQKELLTEGSSVPCPVCYVFSRWAGVGSILDNMSKWQTKYENFSDEQIQERITLLEDKFKGENKVKGKELVATLRDLDEEYAQLDSEQESLADEKKRLQPKKRNAVRENDAHTLSEINNRITEIDKRTKQIKDRLKYIKGSVAPELAWLTQVRAAPDYKQHGRVPSNVLFNLNDAATFAEKYPLAWKYRSTRGPSAGKAILPYSDMQLGDIILGVGNTSADGNKLFANANGEFTAEQKAAVDKAIARTKAQNLIGGQRFQSTSDFRYDYALDYLMAFLECQAIGSFAQTYSKIIEFGDMFAAVGGDFNLSVMPRNKGYITLPNGTNQLVFSSVTGISYEAAVRSSQMHDNGQLILVGINDAHILAALEDSEETRGANIGFVIPYHASGASINEFIRVLVSNLGETYMAKNYMDYSDVQSDAENGKATAAQKRRNDLRTKLLKGKDGAKNWEPSAEDLEFIRGKSADISYRSFEELRAIERKALRGDKAAIAEYESWTRGALWSLYEKLWSNESSEYHGVRLNSAQAKSVMPHEYWNKSVGRDKAYINGFLFRSYCYNLGLSPRFTGVGAKGGKHGDFSDSKGYWKLLIDRPMYNNDGTYRDQQRVNVTKLQKEMLTPSYAKTNWEGYAVQEPSADRASRAADRFVEGVNGGHSKNTKFSLRTKEPPKNTGIAYKVFYAKDGQLYPPMVANPGGAGTPVGVWLDADVGVAAAPSKTGRPQVQAGGKGTNTSKGSLAFRPGWHLGDLPIATQFARKNPETGAKDLFPADFVWAECEYAMDVDYQEEAMSYGYTDNGKFRHSYAGLPKLPTDGYYRYRTNPNPETVPWVITGAMKVNRILTDAETDAILRAAGVEPMKRQGGELNLERLGLTAGKTAQKNTTTESGVVSVGGVRYSLKMSFDEQIDAALGNTLGDNQDVYVGDTPDVLLRMGFTQLPMLTTQKHIRDINHEKSKKNTKWHGISDTKIKKLPQLIEHPAMILKSGTRDDSIVIVTTELDGDELPIVVSVKPDGSGHYNHAEIGSNFITSMYGREAFESWLNTAINEDRVLFVDKKRTQSLLSRTGLYLPNSLNKDGFFDSNISQFWEGVKKYNAAKSNKKSSLKGVEETRAELTRIREEGAKAGKTASEIQQDVNEFVEQQYAELIKEYGAFDRGEKASREIEVPKKSDVDRQVSQTVRTILEAEVTPDTLVPQLEEMVATGEFSYDVFTDKAAMAGAKRTIKAKKFPVALAEWINAVESGTVNKANTALGWELYNQAATNGDVDTAITILTHMVGHQRNAAQALQATRILKKLTPDAQLYSAVKAAQKLEDDVNGRKKKRKATRDDDAVTAAEEVGEAKKDSAKKAKKAHKGVRARKRNGRRRVEVGRDMVGEPFAYEYAQRVGEELAKRLESKNRGNGKQKTFLQQILGELNRFANEKFKTEKHGDALTAIDLLRDYIQNQSFYTEAWEAAQIELRDKYADNPIFNEFINSGIGVDANANPQNAIFMRALVSAAAEIGEGKSVLQRQSALGFTGMADTIADKLIEQTGASGEMADTIRDASYAYVMDAVAETDSDKLVEGAIRSAMKDIGIKLSDVVLEGKGESAQQAIIDTLVGKYGFGRADATATAEVVSERFSDMSKKFAEKRLASMFKERSVVRKTFTERFEQLARLGAFDIGSAYNQRATERLFGVEHPITVNESLAQQFMEAETQEDRDRIMIEIFRDIGSQIPASWVDKFNAWRYMAMLTNPRTHIRNVIGNAAFAPVVLAKDLTASAIESTVKFVAKKTTGKSIGRTKGRVKSDLLKAAWEDFANVQDIVKGGGKYNDTANANRHIEEGRRIYKTKALEAVRKTNSNLLDLEDMWFSKPHYAYALAQYCSANGITADQLKRGKALGNAREYAIREAQKATYRDTNAFSEMIGNLGRKRNANGAEKALGVVMSGVLPFRKTPANILARGVEYSPVGLLKGLTYDLGMVAKGEKTAAEAIDSISAGLTGTGLIALGVFLAAQGLVRGAGGSDEEEKKFEELQGHQAYSLELPDGTSVTLDWLAPEALPFFVGVNLYETTKEGKKGATAADLLSAVGNITDPMLELSCLQSLNDIFDSLGYARSNETSALMAVLASATTSYLTQYVPTLFGQAERSTQGKRMTTYTEKDNWLTSDMQYTLGKTSARIPGWDFGQIPYIDAWGRAESTGNPVANTANNFLNPAYTSKVESSATERELARLYDRTGEAKVLPQRADKSFTVDGERKDLTATEYVKYATEKGQMSYDIVSDLVSNRGYKSMADDEKAEAIAKAYAYADAVAKQKVDGDYDPPSWVEKAITASIKFGMDEADYILYQAALATGDPTKTETVQKADAILAVDGLTDAEMAYLFDGKYQDGKAYRADEAGLDMEEYLLYRIALAKVAKDLGTTTTSTKAKKEALKQFDFTAKEKRYLRDED